MGNFDGYEEVINHYFAVSQARFEIGCYHKWESERDLIIAEVLESLGTNGYDRTKLARILKICDRAILSGLSEISKERRLYSWPKDKEEELRKRISTALQQA